MALTMEGAKIAARMVITSRQQREATPISELIVGVECGGSDTTSGLASNPAVGRFATIWSMRAERSFCLVLPSSWARSICWQRERLIQDGQRIKDMVRWFEDEAARNGADMRGTNPTPDNIEGA